MFKRSYQGVFLFLSIILFTTSVFAGDLWQEIDDSALSQRPAERLIVPDVYKTFRLNRAALDTILKNAPMEFSFEARTSEIILTLPMPDGKFQQFRIENSPIMEPALAAKFPGIQTFLGQGIDDPTATVRFDLTQFGFHAMILSQRGTIYIDPYAKGDLENYITYEKATLRYNDEPFECLTSDPQFNPFVVKELKLFRGDEEPDNVINGSQLRTYRLALAATFEYCAFFGGTEAGAIAGMTTTMNRVVGVYEKDLAIRMTLVANNNLVVYAGNTTHCGGVTCTAANDPYTNNSGGTMLGQNQANLDTVIGTANYDVGHVFSTGGGGVATLNSPCNAGSKARGVTGLGSPTGDGFDIDFVAHEMGHQFGGNHTFNGGTGNCSGGNRNGSTAYEPGSGITIQAYAGICGAQDLAAHSIDTFHVVSLEEMVAFRESGGTCGPATATGNTPPAVTGPGNFNIPKLTPFSLTASATDVNGDSITYDWQEYDLGPQTSSVPNDDTDGQPKPIFRSYLPTSSGTRTFPSLTHILNNANVPPSTTSGFLTGEILPSIARTMVFQVVARDNRANGGGINTATSTLTVSGTAGPFTVTAPNTGLTWAAGSQTVTWSVSGTSGAPINAANVKISYSTDGGNTFPTVLNASTPNDGSQIVSIPVGNTTTARIKVEAVGNIFFDVSNVNFTVSGVSLPTRARADFDGDGRTDVSVFRPSEGNWYLKQSTAGFLAFHWGLSGDQLVPGFYDNDGKTDAAIFRPTNTPGAYDFWIFNSTDFGATVVEFGEVGDIAVVGDYDGDQKTDLSVYRPSTDTFLIRRSTDGGTTTIPLGSGTDIPVVGDYDGDGKTDATIYRSGDNRWIGLLSGGGVMNTVFGAAGDILAPADYNGDGSDDVGVYRPSDGTWRYINGGSTVVVNWGNSTDVPVPGDYDGDGADDIAIYRPSVGQWWILRSTSGPTVDTFGLSTDSAVPRAYLP